MQLTDIFQLPPPLKSPLPSRPRRGFKYSRLERLCEAHLGMCFYCGVGLVHVTRRDGRTLPAHAATRDHFVPKSMSPEEGTVVAACYACNHRKGATPPLVFMASDWLANRRAIIRFREQRRHPINR